MSGLHDVKKAINFIEENLLNDINIDDVARHIHLSKYHLQKIFSIATGFNITEYMRNRRLSLAAQDILTSNIKIIDAALKYMYESPESFTKAFTRLFSYAPSHIRTDGITPEIFHSLSINIQIQGGFGMNKIEEIMEMEKQLEQIAKSYDRHFIYRGKEEDLTYDNLPDYITNHPDYPYWKDEHDGKCDDNRRIELKDYLSPAENMNFIHLGCSLSLMLKGYDKWPSKYYGVDISNETIQLLTRYVGKNNLSIGGLYCGSVHDTPFKDSFFDIGDCIGVLEYYERDFVLNAIKEFHRILKPKAKLVLDIPNIESPSGRMMMLIEGYMGRPDLFDMLPQEFEDMIGDYFEIEDSDKIRAERCGERHMRMGHYYCLRCKK